MVRVFKMETAACKSHWLVYLRWRPLRARYVYTFPITL